jgi:hypothetical protein
MPKDTRLVEQVTAARNIVSTPRFPDRIKPEAPHGPEARGLGHVPWDEEGPCSLCPPESCYTRRNVGTPDRRNGFRNSPVEARWQRPSRRRSGDHLGFTPPPSDRTFHGPILTSPRFTDKSRSPPSALHPDPPGPVAPSASRRQADRPRGSRRHSTGRHASHPAADASSLHVTKNAPGATPGAGGAASGTSLSHARRSTPRLRVATVRGRAALASGGLSRTARTSRV